jgi:hypothetical protein
MPEDQHEQLEQLAVSVKQAAMDLNHAMNRACRAGIRLDIEFSHEQLTLSGRLPPRLEIRAWLEI